MTERGVRHHARSFLIIPQSSFLFMRKRTLHFLHATLVFTVLLLLSVGVFTFRSLSRLIEQSDAVSHTNKVLFQTEQVISTMKDAELGQRGFLLTHDSVFVDIYTRAIQQQGEQLKIVDSLTNIRPQPVQRQRVRRLFHFAQQRNAHIQQILAASLQPERADYDLRIAALVKRGKVTMDSIRILGDSLQNTEQFLLAERIHAKERFSTNTLIMLALISFLAVMVFSGAFYFLIQEIKQRYNYELQLEKTVADLLRTNQDLEQFAYVVSHHLQEPLRKLQTFGNRLSQKYAVELKDDARFLMERMSSTAHQMQSLLTDLLVYTGLGQQADTSNFEANDLSELFQNVIIDQEKQIRELSAVVEWDQQTRSILGDAAQLELLFSHLLQNSLKFVAENRSPQISIHTFVMHGKEIPFATRSQRSVQFIKIIFADNGIGIDLEYRDKIFGLFQRLHPTDYPGTGVGLALCKRIVKHHNGYIHLADTVTGTTFHIYLPVSN